MSAEEVCEHPGHLVVRAATAVAHQRIERALAWPDSIQMIADYRKRPGRFFGFYEIEGFLRSFDAWPSFRGSLDAFCAVPPEALGAVIQRANATFQAIHQWMLPVLREDVQCVTCP